MESKNVVEQVRDWLNASNWRGLNQTMLLSGDLWMTVTDPVIEDGGETHSYGVAFIESPVELPGSFGASHVIVDHWRVT